ncbi:type II toxin-antitoxin system PemK/MazF family toxin [Alsobacter sp. KACC 23698]|uniref:Type II toxin-antitoxin system PemK/MazF family toxin n=1 Tax=Alsobacter sp. KACC 23698 TaxID=3149229 RepID=A0AAU7JBH4_9HYPH
MRRGDLWTVSGGPDYAGKPRPVLVVQADDFDATASLTVCPLTTEMTDASLMRLPIQPGAGNGLRAPSSIMIDKVTTVPKSKLGARIGSLAPPEMTAVNRGLFIFLGLAS